MPSILHRLTIDAPPERVRDLVATRKGIEQWWTGKQVAGDDSIGGHFSVYFIDPNPPAAVFEMLVRTPQRVVWRCLDGPPDWLETHVTFALRPGEDSGTTLLHEGWKHENEFMNGCSTNWAAYLMSLKSGAEGQGFNPFPGGEISRWA
jgi:uncharacterized protein YndB with AHSA1/START domain